MPPHVDGHRLSLGSLQFCHKFVRMLLLLMALSTLMHDFSMVAAISKGMSQTATIEKVDQKRISEGVRVRTARVYLGRGRSLSHFELTD